MKKPKILIIDNSMDITGALKAILCYAKYTSDTYQFCFVIPKGSKASFWIKKEGFELEYLPFKEIRKSLLSILLYFPYLVRNSIALLSLVNKHNAQLVHVNDFYNLTAATGKFFGGKYKLLTHIRFMPDRFPSCLVGFWFSMATQYSEYVICVSQAVKRCLPRHTKVRVIYDTLPEITHEKSLRNEFSNTDAISLLYLAHYIPGKGQDYALEAFHLAYSKHKKLRLKFVGNDMGMKKNLEYKKWLMNRAFTLGISDVVEFSGPSDEINIEFAQCDIALNFSESESFSFTCLEALTYGIPLIASDCGGPSELFVNNESGILVPNKDITAMSAAIIRLLDEKKRKEISIRGRAYVLEKFSEAKTLQSLKWHYHQALSVC